MHTIKRLLIIAILLIPFQKGYATYSETTNEILRITNTRITDIKTQAKDIGVLGCTTHAFATWVTQLKDFSMDIDDFFVSFYDITWETECYLEDIWAMEDKLEEIQNTARALSCSESQTLDKLKDLYILLEIDLALTRAFGSDTINGQAKEDIIIDGYTAKELFLNRKGVFSISYKDKLDTIEQNGFYKNVYRTRLERQYYSPKFLSKSKDFPNGCDTFADIKDKWYNLKTKWKNLYNMMIKPGSILKDVYKDAKRQAKNSSYLSKLLGGIDLGIIRFEMAIKTKSNQGTSNKGITDRLTDIWDDIKSNGNKISTGFINLGKEFVKTVYPQNYKDIKQIYKETVIPTHSYIIEKIDKDQLAVNRKLEISKKLTEYILLFSETSNQTTEIMQQDLILLSKCLKKGFTRNKEDQKKLGCYIDTEGVLQMSNDTYSLPNFEKYFHKYINKQCGSILSKCPLKDFELSD